MVSSLNVTKPVNRSNWGGLVVDPGTVFHSPNPVPSFSAYWISGRAHTGCSLCPVPSRHNVEEPSDMPILSKPMVSVAARSREETCGRILVVPGGISNVAADLTQ